MRRLNLCCGTNKIENCDNADINADLSPDLSFDIRKPFPLESNLYDEIYLFHAIEHIEKKHHLEIFKEIWRVMKFDGTLYLSFPEFRAVAQHWLDNYMGMRDFWENTIFGRQNTPYDFHFCAMDSGEVWDQLKMCGFVNLTIKPEPSQLFNTIVKATKGPVLKTYEDLLQDSIDKVKIAA